MEFVLFETAFVSLSILECLYPFTIKHSIAPSSLVFDCVVCSMECTISTLNTIFKVSFISASITPPEHSSSIPFTPFEFPFIYIHISPSVYSSSFLLIISKLSNIWISFIKIQFPKPRDMPIDKLSIDNLLCCFIIDDSYSMWLIIFDLANVGYFRVFKVSWVRECRLHGKDCWRIRFRC